MSPRCRSDQPSLAPITVRLTPAERQLAKQAAAVNQQPLSTFMRDALMSATYDCLEPEALPTLPREVGR